MMIFTANITDSGTYYTTETKQVQYYLRFHDERWELYSERKNMYRHVGTTRFFSSLMELEATIKSFVGISKLITEV